MPQKTRQSDFYRTELDLNPEEIDIEFSDGPVGKVLSFLFGRDRINNIWREQALDFAGRAYVTQGVVNPLFRAGQQATITAQPGAQILAANPTRQVVFLQNVSTNLIRFNFFGAVSGNDLFLSNDATLRISGYTGAIFAATDSGTSLMNILEA